MISKKIQTPALDSYYYGVAAVFSFFKSTQLVETTTKLNLIKNIFILIYNFLHFKKLLAAKQGTICGCHCVKKPISHTAFLSFIFVTIIIILIIYYHHFCLSLPFRCYLHMLQNIKTIFLSDFAGGTLGI